MKWSVIGLFGRVMNNNVELCSDWLFHSAAQCWALLWLAVSQCSSMLSSALIGCFTVRLNVELCSDWLISVAHRKETQGKYIFQYFLAQLYRWVIILYIQCGHQGAAINTRGIETAFERSVDHVIVSLSLSRFAIARTLFILWSGSTYLTFYKIRCLSVVLRICKSFAIILSHLSLLCLCGKWKLMYCNVTGYR